MNNQESLRSLKDYVDSGQYFIDAKTWHKNKYMQPFNQRSYVAIITTIIFFILCSLVLHINSMLPTVIPVKYSINANISDNKSAKIIHADQTHEDALTSVTELMLHNYVKKRESYSFPNLKSQFTFIKNNSTRIMFRRFYNDMSIDNPSSPLIKYKKFSKRNVQILDIKYPGNSTAVVKFVSNANDETGTLIENIVWTATIGYEIDKIDPTSPPGTRFNFTVTSYEVKIIEDKLKK